VTLVGSGPSVTGRELSFAAPQAITNTVGLTGDLQAGDWTRDGDLDVIGRYPPVYGHTMAVRLEGPAPWTAPTLQELNLFSYNGIDTMAMVNDRGHIGLAVCGWWRDFFTEIQWYGMTIARAYVDKLVGADMDGDGDIDLMGGGAYEHVGDKLISRVRWWENEGLGRDYWTEHTVADRETTNLECEAADLDGDGDLDIVGGVSSTQASLEWWENLDRHGTEWRAHIIDTNRPASYDPIAVDLDLDGDLDLVTTHPIAPGVSVWQNTNGRFTLAAAFGDDGHVTVGDLDGDGDPDLVFAAFRGTELAWYENNRGALDTWTKHPLVTTPDALGGHAPVGDFDRDGDLDIVYYVEDTGLFWLENQTIGRNATFPQKQVIRKSVNGAECVQAADFNRDGLVDLVGSAFSEGSIKVWLNLDPAHNLWLERKVTDAFSGVEAVFPADLDNDGDLDILGASFTSDAVRWWENDGSNPPSWTEHAIAEDFNGAHDVCAGDIDRDGDLDVVAVAYFDNQVAWWSNDGSPRDGGWVFHSVSDTFLGANSVTLADMDDDGLLDIVASAWVSDQVLWWRNVESDGKRIFEARRIADQFLGARSVAAADLNGNGKLDLIAAAFTLGRICWWEYTPGTADWPMHQVNNNDFPGANDVCPADLDNDGDVDLVGAFMTEGKILWWENVNSLGTEWLAHTSEMVFPSAAAVCAADIDQDGDLDLFAAAEGTTDQMAWWANRGGQYALRGQLTGLQSVCAAQKIALLSVDAQHNGRSGNHPMELVRLQLLFEDASGLPLSTAQWNQRFQAITIYRDDGNGQFGIEDTPVRTFAPTLNQGVATLEIEDGRPSASVVAARTVRFHIAFTTAPSVPPPAESRFRCTYLGSETASAEDQVTDLPLLPEFCSAVATPVYQISTLPLLRIQSISRAPSGDVSLSWNSLGIDYRYTVEYSTLAATPSWKPVPWVSWPILATNWTDTEVLPGASRIFYRVKAERQINQ
jgi:hypothetical protein